MKDVQIETCIISEVEIGTEKDYDQYFYQLGAKNIAVFSGVYKEHVLEIFNAGEQKVFYKGEELIEQPEVILANKDDLDYVDSCWLLLSIYKSGNLLFTSDDDLTIYSSIKEAIKVGKELIDGGLEDGN